MSENQERGVKMDSEELGFGLPKISNLPGFKQFKNMLCDSIDNVSKDCGKKIGDLANTTESTLNTIKNDIIGEIKKQIPSLPNIDPTKIFNELQDIAKGLDSDVVDKINHMKSSTHLVGVVTLIDEIAKCACIFDLPSKVMPEQFNDKDSPLNIILADFKLEFDNGISVLKNNFASTSICLRIPKDIHISDLSDKVLKYVNQINKHVETKNIPSNQMTTITNLGYFYIIAGSIIDVIRIGLEQLKDLLMLIGSTFPLTIGVELGGMVGAAGVADAQGEVEIELCSIGTFITEKMAFIVNIFIYFLEWISSLLDRIAQVA